MWLLIGRPYVHTKGLVIIHDLIHGEGAPEEEVIKLFDQKIQRKEVRRLKGPYRPVGKKNNDLWLSDGIMNGLVRILTTCQSKGNGVIFTDTYFYTKLMQLRRDDPKNQGKFNYQEVKQQCKNAMKKYGVTFLESKAVYIPIHLDEQHWICAVIMKKTNELIIYNDFGIQQSHGEIMNNLLDLVVEEFKIINHKHSQSELNTLRNKWSKRDMSAELPQQTNGKTIGCTMSVTETLT